MGRRRSGDRTAAFDVPARRRRPRAPKADGHYLKSMSGASPHFGTAALRSRRISSLGATAAAACRREKLPMLAGESLDGHRMLFSSANGELLAIMTTGVLQRFRVGGANGVATKYLAREMRRRLA